MPEVFHRDSAVPNMTVEQRPTDPTTLPLVVDVDGTLLRTDLLHESLVRLLGRRPWMIFPMLGWLFGGKAAFKRKLAEQVELDADHLPVNENVIEHIHLAREQGRPVCLATASDQEMVEPVAARWGPFEGVFASDGQINLRGSAKAEALVEQFGARGYDYLGDAHPDLAVWSRARTALIVAGRRRLRKRLEAEHDQAEVIGTDPSRPWAWLTALRPQQWLKNLLVFVPLLAAHSLDPGQWLAGVLAFAAFCLVASAVYLLNDLVDLPHDRAHARKCRRELASGALSIPYALVMAPVLLMIGLGVALWVSAPLAALLLAYLIVTSSYSVVLKRLMLVDVFVLALLYTSRVMAGALATSILPSEWLLAFSGFVFLCLALTKRQSELADARVAGRSRPSGRGYHLDDLPMLSMLATASGFSAVVVLALYISSDQVVALYDQPLWLWPLAGLFLFWIARMLMLGHRGKLLDDPLVFVLKDPVSLVVAVAGAGLFLLAT